MSSKVRVYEVARDLGMDNKAVVALLQSVGASEVRNHMSAVAPEVVERVKRHLEKQTAQKVVEERIRPTVVKRRAVQKRSSAPAEAGQASAPEEGRSAPSATSAAPVVRRSKPAVAPAPAAEKSSVKQPAAPVRRPTPSAAASSPAPASRAARPSAAVSARPSQARAVAGGEQRVPSAAPAVVAPSSPAATPSAPVSPKPTPSAPASPPTLTASAVKGSAGADSAAASSAPTPSSTLARQAAEVASMATSARTGAPQKTGIDVWEGRPGVPMPQQQRGGPTPRRVQYDAKAGSPTPGRARTGPTMGRIGRGMRHRGIGSLARAKGTGQPVTQERSAHKKVVRIEESINLQALANKMGVKAGELLMKLMGLGLTGVNINSTLDADTAKIVSNEFGWEVEDVAVSEEQQIVEAQGLEAEDDENKLPRPPVVTVMGHVDHGKTSLLDVIRKANVVSGEAGGITQHIGAYSVHTPRGDLTFLDTPGHEAFTAMRARGAQATDLVILVVAADDGVMPQTVEAINHARAAKVPIVVAINKCDKADAQPERVRRELSEQDLVPEEWGGDTLFTEVSAHTKAGIDQLLEQVVLQSELLELRADPSKPATGVVVEAELDRGRGPVATILVTEGTLHRGEVILAGGAHGKVRAMHDSQGKEVLEAGPSIPVSVIGLNDVPSAGDPVHIVKDMKSAQQIAESRKTKERRSLALGGSQKRMSLEELAQAMQEAEQLELKVIVKADVQGSAEAVSDALTKLSTEKVRVSVVHSAVGAITENDINLAVAAGAIIIGFNVRPAGKASTLAQREKIEIRQYNVIYNVVDDVKAAMEGLLAPTLVEKTLGSAEVRQVFKISKAGNVAGCMVTSGLIRRSASVRLLRDSVEVWTGKISTLKRFKDDAREVKEGFECGISLEGYGDVKVKDVIEAFELEEVKQTL